MNIVFAYCNKDADLAVKSAQAIAAIGGNLSHRATLCCPDGTHSSDLIQSILKQSFPDVRRIVAQSGFDGWPLGPNQLFADASVACEGAMDSWYFWEPDCVPLRAGWVDELEYEYRRQPSILGTIRQEGIGGNGKRMHKLVIGSAVYPPNLLQLCPLARNLTNYNMAYLSQAVNPEPWDVYCRHEFLRIARNTDLIQSPWKSAGYRMDGSTIRFSAIDQDAEDIVFSMYPGFNVLKNAAVVHGCKDGTLHDLVINGLFDIVPVPQEEPVDPNNPLPYTPPIAVQNKIKKMNNEELRARRQAHARKMTEIRIKKRQEALSKSEQPTPQTQPASH